MQVSKGRKVTGWVITVLIAVVMIGPSAMTKLFPPPEIAAEFTKGGFTVELMRYIAFVEIFVAIMTLFPATAFLGCILVTGYLGGAVLVHAQKSDPGLLIPLIMGILSWVALGLRDPRVFSLAFRRQKT